MKQQQREIKNINDFLRKNSEYVSSDLLMLYAETEELYNKCMKFVPSLEKNTTLLNSRLTNDSDLEMVHDDLNKLYVNIDKFNEDEVEDYLKSLNDMGRRGDVPRLEDFTSLDISSFDGVTNILPLNTVKLIDKLSDAGKEVPTIPFHKALSIALKSDHTDATDLRDKAQKLVNSSIVKIPFLADTHQSEFIQDKMPMVVVKNEDVKTEKESAQEEVLSDDSAELVNAAKKKVESLIKSEIPDTVIERFALSTSGLDQKFIDILSNNISNTFSIDNINSMLSSNINPYDTNSINTFMTYGLSSIINNSIIGRSDAEYYTITGNIIPEDRLAEIGESLYTLFHFIVTNGINNIRTNNNNPVVFNPRVAQQQYYA